MDEKQEPVAWKYETPMYVSLQWKKMDDWREGTWTALYTAPPQRSWQGLTDEDIYSIIESNVPPKLTSLFEIAEWVAKVVEAKLKEKNNAI